MNNIKTEEFHKPFIKNLVIMGLVTIVSMVSARYFIIYSFSIPSSTPVYTSSESGISSK